MGRENPVTGDRGEGAHNMLRDQLTGRRENKAQKQAHDLVRQMLEDKKSFAVWGAGATGKSTLDFLKQASDGVLVPQCIVDNNQALWGQNHIVSPEDFMKAEPLPKRMIVSVYVADQVIAQLKEMGYTGEIIDLNVHLADDLWDFYEGHMEELEELYLLLADSQSRETLSGFLNGVRQNDAEYFRRINGNSKEKLLDPKIMKYTDEEFFVDVGAFTGDTIREFLELTGNKFQKIVGIEPDRKNYDVLQANIGKWKLGNISSKNVAVGETDGITHFMTDMSESSRRANAGGQEIQMRRLDTMEELQDLTVLKVSTNGCDLQALQGARNLILRNKPKISTYASGMLLWEIPEYLHKLVPEYKIYCRHYGTGIQAMICYAVC